MPENVYKNKVLQNLAPDVIERLRLKPVTLELRHEMEYPGSTIDHLFFIEEGLGSMTTTFEDGFQVEVGLFGYEAVVGVSALMGTRRSLNRVYMQLAGHGFCSSIDVAKKEFERHGEFHNIALRYVQAQLTQATQSAGCNAHHETNARLARWLLLCADRANSTHFSILQEFLADMLGSTRSTVSIAAAALKDEGLITYVRGELDILDREGLEAKACECYRVVKDHLDNYIEFDTGFAV